MAPSLTNVEKFRGLYETTKGWALYASYRKSDGTLAQRCKVVQIGKCTLVEAQEKAKEWIDSN